MANGISKPYVRFMSIGFEVLISNLMPKNTVLSLAVALKLPPVMVTAVSTGPAEGEKEVIKGASASDCKTIKTVKEKRSKFFCGEPLKQKYHR